MLYHVSFLPSGGSHHGRYCIKAEYSRCYRRKDVYSRTYYQYFYTTYVAYTNDSYLYDRFHDDNCTESLYRYVASFARRNYVKKYKS